MTVTRYIIASAPAAIIALAVFAYTAPAHTFHTSLMQLEYNNKEQLVEISLQVFTHDLENILSRRTGKDFRLDKTPAAPQLTLAYLNETINLKDHDGQIMTLSWVGMEPQADAVWLYVETKLPGGLDRLQLRDRVFFDLLEDQLNRVHIKYEDKKCDLVFKPGDDFKPITLSASPGSAAWERGHPARSERSTRATNPHFALSAHPS